MNAIEEKYLKFSEFRAGILLLRPSDAIRMVEDCRRIRLQILGIDGFKLEGQFTQPLMEHSIDLSQPDGRQNECWDSAKKFLSERSSAEYFFEVVTADHP